MLRWQGKLAYDSLTTGISSNYGDIHLDKEGFIRKEGRYKSGEDKKVLLNRKQVVKIYIVSCLYSLLTCECIKVPKTI